MRDRPCSSGHRCILSFPIYVDKGFYTQNVYKKIFNKGSFEEETSYQQKSASLFRQKPEDFEKIVLVIRLNSDLGIKNVHEVKKFYKCLFQNESHHCFYRSVNILPKKAIKHVFQSDYPNCSERRRPLKFHVNLKKDLYLFQKIELPSTIFIRMEILA